MNAYTDADVRAAVKATRRVKGGTIVGLLVENEIRLALDKVAPAIAARTLRDFADNHVHFQSAARMQEDLHARADEIESA